MKPRPIVRISRGVAAGQAASVSRKRSIFSQAPRQSTSRHLIRMFLLESGSTMLPRNASQPHDRYCAMQLTQFAIQAGTRAPKSNS